MLSTIQKTTGRSTFAPKSSLLLSRCVAAVAGMLGAAGLLLGSLATQAQTIDTVIGAVDGIPGSAFNLTNPDSVVTDSAGNIYITTWRFDHAIRKYNRTSGTVSLFAGTGVATF